MTYIFILLAVVGGALLLGILARLLESGSLPRASGHRIGNLGIDLGKYSPQIKTLGTVLLIILLLSIFFPQSAGMFFTDIKLLAMFAVAVAILFLNFSVGGSRFLMNIFKWFVWGVIAYIIFVVLIQPYVDFDALDEKFNETTERIEQQMPSDSVLPQKNLPPISRIGPPTKTSPVKISPEGTLEFIKVSVDGTNEYESYPVGKRNGHDTTMILEAGECVEVEHVAGVLSYIYQTREGNYKIGHPQIYGGDSWAILGYGDTAFHPYEDTRNAVLLVIWSGNDYEVFRIPQAHEKVAGCNTFAKPAHVSLFFNTPELLRDHATGVQEDMFSYNGWDGSRAVFDIKRCKETIKDFQNARYFECGR